MRFELVFLYLYDVGRSIDIRALGRDLSFKSVQLSGTVPKRRVDTPESLQLPESLALDLGRHRLDPETRNSAGFEQLDFAARLYEEGVVSLECRARLDCALEELHTLRSRTLVLENQEGRLDDLVALRYEDLYKGIESYVESGQYVFDQQCREDYHIFCLLDPLENPQDFFNENRNYLAPFLLGEDPHVALHESQISDTLRTPFSFTGKDAAIFDMDRALILDPQGDYNDLVMIIEHANYQLLELRTLDRLLDRLLDDAERDLRRLRINRKPGKTATAGQSDRTRRKAKAFRQPSVLESLIQPFKSLGFVSQKLGNLQPLRLDALFILENLENSSRIIGDYYLEQIYRHLCSIFNTSGWKRNVERRLEILQSVYTESKADVTDRTMMLLEILVVLMIAVEVVALFLPVLSH